MVWYSPEVDMLRIAKKSDGFLFKDKIGELHLCYFLNGRDSFKTHTFYLIGEL